MRGLALAIKALGINLKPEHIKAVEDIVPQLPAKLNQAGTVINSALQNFDERLKKLEAQNAEILEVLKNGRRAGSDRAERTN